MKNFVLFGLVLVFIGQFIVSNTTILDFSGEEELSIELEQDSEENEENESQKDFFLDWNTLTTSDEAISKINNEQLGDLQKSFSEIHIKMPTPPPRG